MKTMTILSFALMSLMNSFANELTEDDKKLVLKSLAQMEADPFSEDSMKMLLHAGKRLDDAENFKVTVNVSELIIPLLKSDYKYKDELFLQFIVSNAGYAITNQGKKDSVYDRNLYSIKRTLAVYKKTLAQEKEAVFPHFDNYLKLSDDELKALVKETLKEANAENRAE